MPGRGIRKHWWVWTEYGALLILLAYILLKLSDHTVSWVESGALRIRRQFFHYQVNIYALLLLRSMRPPLVLKSCSMVLISSPANHLRPTLLQIRVWSRHSTGCCVCLPARYLRFCHVLKLNVIILSPHWQQLITVYPRNRQTSASLSDFLFILNHFRYYSINYCIERL